MERLFRREPRDWKNTMALDLLAVVLMMMIWMTACSSGSQGAAKTNKTVTSISLFGAWDAALVVCLIDVIVRRMQTIKLAIMAPQHWPRR